MHRRPAVDARPTVAGGRVHGRGRGSPLVVEAAFGHAPLQAASGSDRHDAGGPVTDRLALPLRRRSNVRPSAPARPRSGSPPRRDCELRRELVARGAPAGLVDAAAGGVPAGARPDDGLDPVGDAELVLLARRAPDARAVLADLAAGGAVVAGCPAQPRAQPVFDAWRELVRRLVREPTPGRPPWNPQRMEYRFQVAAGIGATPSSSSTPTEYAGGRLDWYAFDVAAEGAPALGARGALERRDVRVLPTPARFAGQAASRWWQLEDGAVWFGDLGARPRGPGARRRRRLRHACSATTGTWSRAGCRPASSSAQRP